MSGLLPALVLLALVLGLRWLYRRTPGLARETRDRLIDLIKWVGRSYLDALKGVFR